MKRWPRRLSASSRSLSALHDLLTNRHGLRSEDIFFDCLTFPITTGNPTDRRLGLETLDGIEQIMQKLPKCQSILGREQHQLRPRAGRSRRAQLGLSARGPSARPDRGHRACRQDSPRNQIATSAGTAALDLIYDRDDKEAARTLYRPIRGRRKGRLE
jgi:5-methyltetrahydrofolate--homocysteine methyltransferase